MCVADGDKSSMKSVFKRCLMMMISSTSHIKKSACVSARSHHKKWWMESFYNALFSRCLRAIPSIDRKNEFLWGFFMLFSVGNREFLFEIFRGIFRTLQKSFILSFRSGCVNTAYDYYNCEGKILVLSWNELKHENSILKGFYNSYSFITVL